MLTKQERKQVSQYLHTFHPLTTPIAFLGLSGLILDGLGLIILIPLAYHIWWHYQHISDEEFDELLKKDLEPLEDRARQVVSLEEVEFVRDPIIRYGRHPKDMDHCSKGKRLGKDQVLRFTPVNAAVVFFTETELVVYQCVWDVFRGHAAIDSTFRAYYKEIVGLETRVHMNTVSEKSLKAELVDRLTKTDDSELPQTLRISSTLELALLSKSGNPLKVYLPYSTVLDRNDIAHGINEGIYKVVASVKKMIDDKKNNNPITLVS